MTNDIKKVVKDALIELDVPTKSDIKALSQKIDRNQKALDQIDDISKKLIKTKRL